MTIIVTDEKIRIECCGSYPAPYFNDFHKRFYVTGKRFIKTKQTFSTQVLLHNFKSFFIEKDD